MISFDEQFHNSPHNGPKMVFSSSLLSVSHLHGEQKTRLLSSALLSDSIFFFFVKLKVKNNNTNDTTTKAKAETNHKYADDQQEMLQHTRKLWNEFLFSFFFAFRKSLLLFTVVAYHELHVAAFDKLLEANPAIYNMN